MHNKITKRASSAAKILLPARLGGSRATKSIVKDFAERAHLVYFGYVSQLTDDHRIVRGLTVSTKHKDDHYCIGTYNNYDTVFVERTDTILTTHKHTWHIMEFDLKYKTDVPHVFIGSGKHGLGFHSLLSAKYPAMSPVDLGYSQTYPKDFTEHFNVYTVPTKGILVEYFIDAETAAMIAQHFKGLVIEITDDSLYVYSEKPVLTLQLLDTMAINGTWLAAKIDEKSQLM